MNIMICFSQVSLLPLNEFCNVLHEEILLILGHPMPIPQDWLLSPKNHPFGTSDHIKRFQLPASVLVGYPEDVLRDALKEGAKTILIRRHLYKDKKKEIKKKRKADRKSGTVPSPGAGTEGENEELVP
ncbi:hypothetical protein Ocin01_18791 [Orchesella cincta]|uniref:Uncharacterized protein n=1 Tax=Orchesella cincta TaxID=48709 RepID=A0A1D2M4Q5_ORCCI|nr:hypothetical protein Ocin01_18791 [Orchesella cincta]